MNERIKELRKDLLGLTMEKFGEHLGVKKNTVSQWESGINKVPDQMFKSICREFNVNEKWLRDGVGEPFIIPEDETADLVADILEDDDDDFYADVLALVRTYRQLKPEHQEVIKIFCQKLAENKKNREA